MASRSSLAHLLFDRALAQDQKNEFEKQVAGFFSDLWEDRGERTFDGSAVTDLRFDDDRRLAEFRAWAPHDESWLGANMAAVTRFSREVRRVVSYQGLPLDVL